MSSPKNSSLGQIVAACVTVIAIFGCTIAIVVFSSSLPIKEAESSSEEQMKLSLTSVPLQPVLESKEKTDAPSNSETSGNLVKSVQPAVLPTPKAATPEVVKPITKPLTEDDRMRFQVITKEPQYEIPPGVTADAVKMAFENPVKTLADLELLNSILPFIDKLRPYITRSTFVDGKLVTGSCSLRPDLAIHALLPVEINKQVDQREQLIRLLYIDPDSPELQKQCVDAHKVLVESLASASSYIKEQLKCTDADICKDYCIKLKEDLVFNADEKRTRALDNLCPS